MKCKQTFGWSNTVQDMRRNLLTHYSALIKSVQHVEKLVNICRTIKIGDHFKACDYQ